ncbi:MAG TPA: tetratricopeptide repeat protein [Pirellulales bacterium]|nr:tetratricopeptide repeat protein [Pirellulales bacterium]
MRCRWMLVVATVAVALSARAVGAHHGHSGGGSLHHDRQVAPMTPVRFPGPLAPEPNATRQPKQAAVGGAAVGGAKPPKRKTRVSNAPALARAKEYLKFGDEHFRTQRFSDAYQRYKKAASAAPDVAEAHFRQGFSLLALGKYDSAHRAFLRGLELQPDWAKSTFRLDELYGANRLAKTNQFEQLAAAAGDQPGNSSLMFLLGVELYFDGQRERARKFFVRAGRLGEDQTHLSGFFKALGPARNAERPAPKRNGRMEL